MSDLPPGWAHARLNDLSVEVTGSIAPKPSEQYELYSVPAFPGGIPDYVVGTAIGSNKRPVSPNDVLLCKINPRINRVWYVGSFNGRPQLASTEFIPLRLPRGHETTARYLMWYLRAPDFRGWIKLNAEGATGSHTRAKSPAILRQSIPIAPLREQTRIVAIVEEQFSRLDAAVAALQRVRVQLSRMRAAVYQAAISGRLRESKSSLWRTVRLGDVAEVSGGITKNPKRAPRANSVPFLRVANVPRNGLDLDDVHRIELFAGELERYRLRPGDLLVVEGNGSPDQIGRSALWSGAIDPCVHQNHLIRVRPGAEVVPEYLNLYWNAPSTMEAVQAQASSTSGLHTLSTGKIRGIPVTLPPLDAQREIVQEVARELSRIDAVEMVATDGLSKAANLRSTILGAAFSGQLAQQDPADEPASVLLERIAAERASRNGHKATPAVTARTSKSEAPI